LDVNPYPYLECVYGSLARNVNNFVHLVYQRDDYPGISINPNGGASMDPENSNNTSDIVYLKIKPDLSLAVTDLSHAIDKPLIFPNPATNQTRINFNFELPQSVHLRIIDALGQEVLGLHTEKTQGPTALFISLDSLPRGLYFIQMVWEKQTFVSKLVLE
jgi:hypothetical protein